MKLQKDSTCFFCHGCTDDSDFDYCRACGFTKNLEDEGVARLVKLEAKMMDIEDERARKREDKMSERYKKHLEKRKKLYADPTWQKDLQDKMMGKMMRSMYISDKNK